jgi:hypothetical protein
MMLTKIIGQLDTETNPAIADYIEIEHSGVSGKLAMSAVASAYSSSTEAVAGTSNSYLMTPLKTREAFNCTGTAPVYACRAWVAFNNTTTSSALSGTYTRTVGTTTTVIVATAHGYITGNVAYVNFTTGGASSNTYTVTVTDADHFTVQTVSTSSVLTSNLTLPRCPILGGGNVNNVSYVSSSITYINFAVAMPTDYYMSFGSAYKYDGNIDNNMSMVLGGTTAIFQTKYSTISIAGAATGGLYNSPLVKVGVIC